MEEAVSGILLGRSREADGLSRMVTVSLVVHLTIVGLLFVIPPGWLTTAPAPRETPMMISLGLPPGQQTGGMTAIGSRPVQAVAPPETRPVIAPPAAKVPEMVAPSPEVKPKPAPKPIDKPIDKSATRKPSTGAEVKAGPARVETPNAAEVQFGGLAQGGGGTGGVRTEGNFCCPEYIETMKNLIYQNWDRNLGAAGQVEIKFAIRRDGMLANVGVERTSGNPLLDLESRRAVLATQKIPPLPDRYTGQTLTVYLVFEYRR
jgi:TonB family protein